MNAFELCEKYDIKKLGELSTFVIEFDYKLNILKNKVKMNEDYDAFELKTLTNEVKMLQGHLNSILAKRELFEDMFTKTIARSLANQLVTSVTANKGDVHYNDIKVISKRGGVSINGIYYPTSYRDTKLYRLINCN